MTTTQRTEAIRRKTILASLTLYPMTTEQLRRRFPHCQRLLELLQDMTADGLIHCRPSVQPAAGLVSWHPGSEGDGS